MLELCCCQKCQYVRLAGNVLFGKYQSSLVHHNYFQIAFRLRILSVTTQVERCSTLVRWSTEGRVRGFSEWKALWFRVLQNLEAHPIKMPLQNTRDSHWSCRLPATNKTDGTVPKIKETRSVMPKPVKRWWQLSCTWAMTSDSGSLRVASVVNESHKSLYYPESYAHRTIRSQRQSKKGLQYIRQSKRANIRSPRSLDLSSLFSSLLSRYGSPKVLE